MTEFLKGCPPNANPLFGNFPMTLSIHLNNLWYQNDRLYGRWSPRSKVLLQQFTKALGFTLKGLLSKSCTHLKGHGGIKAAVRQVQQRLDDYPYVARFDVARYYASINHQTLLHILAELGISAKQQASVETYLRLPDKHQSGCGLLAGGSLSPLLGAVYLSPLDNTMDKLMHTGRIYYCRFMDDFVILAKTRWHFRTAIARLNASLNKLSLRLHSTKRFIGKTSKGFDFLGYHIHPGRRLRPSAESLRRFAQKFRRLYEHKANTRTLWRYTKRWAQWLWGGLCGLVTTKGGEKYYFFSIAKRLGIKGLALSPLW